MWDVYQNQPTMYESKALHFLDASPCRVLEPFARCSCGLHLIFGKLGQFQNSL